MAERHAPDLTQALVAHALALRGDRIPPEALAVARHCLLDWIGVALAGWQEAPVQILLAELAEEGGRPAATLLGSGARTGAQQAALINGTAGHALDFDDVHLASRVHPSAPLFPAILAAAERDGASGRRVLEAFLAGVEVQSRIAAVMGDSHYRQGWHNTGTLGSFGATAAVAHLAGLDVAVTCQAMGIAGTQAAGLRAVFGSMAKPLHAGRAAATGLLAARLAARGFTSHKDILGAPDGFAAVHSRELRPEAMLAAPERLAACSILFKYHASCYGTHAPIEAALRLRAGIAGRLDAIDGMTLDVEPQYLSVCNIPEPRNGSEAKFCLRHAVALALAGHDTMAAESFSEAACADPVLRALRARITVAGDASLPRATARLRVAIGAEPIESVADVSAPEPDPARQWQRLCGKFRTLAEPALGVAGAARIIALCDGFDAAPDVAALLESCAVRR